MTFVPVLLWLCAASFAALMVYWTMVFPTVVAFCRLRITEAQDDVRLAVHDGKISSEALAYRDFESLLHIAKVVMAQPSAAAIGRGEMENYDLEAIAVQSERIRSEPLLWPHFKSISGMVLLVGIACSPGTIFKIVCLAFVALFSVWAKDLIIKMEREAFAKARFHSYGA